MALIVLIAGLAIYSVYSKSQKEESLNGSINNLPEQQGSVEEDLLSEEEKFLETQKSGDVGELEIKKGETEEDALREVNPEALEKPVRPPGMSMPPEVFDTKGEILSVGTNKMSVQGNGENFEDQKPRTLNVLFIETTITFEKGQLVSYKGLEGLKHLKPGEKILINSSENIRGKTEFNASYINKI